MVKGKLYDDYREPTRYAARDWSVNQPDAEQPGIQKPCEGTLCRLLLAAFEEVETTPTFCSAGVNGFSNQ